MATSAHRLIDVRRLRKRYREADGEDLTPAFITRVAPLATKVTLAETQPVTLNLPIVSIR